MDYTADKIKELRNDKLIRQKQNHVWLRISLLCNNKCIFCLDSWNQIWELQTDEEIKKQVRELFIPWKWNVITIVWGEATINPRFTEYIKYARSIWYDQINTISNWLMFSSLDFCKKAFEAWIDNLSFSIHWHTASLHDYLVGNPWAFRMAIKWIINIKKYFPNIPFAVSIVVNKLNVKFLPDILDFFIKLGVNSFALLQIVPWWKWFWWIKDKIYYDINKDIDYLLKAFSYSKRPWIKLITNFFPIEVFEQYPELIPDPLNIKTEVTWEDCYERFNKFITSWWKDTPECYWENCVHCYLKNYCNDYIDKYNIPPLKIKDAIYIRWENHIIDVIDKYWTDADKFVEYLFSKNSKLINMPKCLNWSWLYQSYNDFKINWSIEEYTDCYIHDLNRKKSFACKKCIHNDSCEWIHINFLRSYGLKILKEIKN